MPKLTVLTGDITCEVPFSQGPSVRELLEAAGIRVRTGCRGNGACGLCLMHLEEGNANDPTDNERLILSTGQLYADVRLACQVTPQGDLRIRLDQVAASAEPSVEALSGGWNRDAVPYGNPRLFEAFVKSAQYIARLKSQQDLWDHLGKLVMTYFPAQWTAFAGKDRAGGVAIHHCSLPDAVAGERILTAEMRTLIGEVLESGFLASRVIPAPEPSMTAFVPITEEHGPGAVMLIGHKTADALPHEQLNIYLAVAGLAGTTSERLRNERELNQHRAHLEELVKDRTAELEAANGELEAFSYSVSHDLRSPLRAIDGFSQALLEDYAGRLDDEGREHLLRIRTATQKMGCLIDDLLNLARVSRVELKRETVDLSELAAKIADGLRTDNPGREAHFMIAPGLPARGDERLLTVVLENLLGNAWKYTSKRAETKIEFGNMEMQNETAPHLTSPPDGRGIAGTPSPLGGEGKVRGHSELVYFVRDNGAGFDMAYAGKLFNAFQRLHSAREYPGTGVGLATVQRIISRHGGRIWAEGEPGKGATFYFTL